MRWLQNLLLLWLFAVVFSKRSKQNQQVSSREDGAPPELKQELLNLMGLPRRPTLSYVTRVYGKRFSAPRYMIKLYNSLSQNQTVESPGFCCNGTVVDSRAVGADTIMSYLNHEKGRRPKISHKHATFKFNVLTPIGEKVTATEFRLYKEPRPGDMLHWRNSTYKLRLYQVIYPAQVLYLLEQKIIRSWETGWQDFDITAAGKAWSETPEKNYGLELAVLNFNNEEISPHKAGFVGFHGPQEKRPFLVNFFRQDGEVQFSRRIYPSEMRGHRSARVSRDLSSQMGGGSNGISSNKLCQRRVLHVSFRKLSWEDWVIAPEGYSAYYCDGECSFPLNANMNATNHAIVQTLVHLMNPRTVPKPCCAPTKLTAISVLYFDDSNNVVLKKYNNMVVTACGCH